LIFVDELQAREAGQGVVRAGVARAVDPLRPRQEEEIRHQ
jgi:hypothetical protein